MTEDSEREKPRAEEDSEHDQLWRYVWLVDGYRHWFDVLEHQEVHRESQVLEGKERLPNCLVVCPKRKNGPWISS